MKKVFFCVFLIGLSACLAREVKITKFKMDSEYAKHYSETFVTKLDVEYRANLYEPFHKKWIFYLGGKVNPDYDHFGNEIKINTYTTFGIDF